MKGSFPLFRCCLLAAGLCIGFFPLQSRAAAPGQPNITSARFDGQNVVVNVTVPSGIAKVTLEARARIGAGTWVPSAVTRLDGKGGNVTFRLAKSAQLAILRVRADATEELPAAFYAGTNSFVAGTSTTNPTNNMTPVSDAAAGAGGSANAPGAGGATRTVVESDIWNVDGNTLYFFNQYRGLQVIDLTTPDSPVVTGTYPMANAGEQMYVLNGNYVVLLVQDNCSSADGNSQVLILDVTGGVPKPVATLPVPGWIQESRLVGTALYVASQSSRPIAGSTDGAYEWGSTVSSFDLSTPGNPSAKSSLWYSGYGNVIYATDQYLFVATQSAGNWWQSVLNCIDISAPDGTMKALASITLPGQVPDKYKINQSGDVLTVISQDSNSGTRGGVTTVLQNYSLADPNKPVSIGQLEFPQREALHATSFDGDRVYVVTFYQMDPLWVVDISDPTNPRVAGQLQVPGWSTYIEPLGDRLVAIGINDTNDWRVAVSLFDVHDPANPALLSKVPLGTDYSWSEASYDDKAFTVLPEAGLILVPYQGYETNGYASSVQLIDLNTDSLKARGTIDHSFQPRRATLHNDRIYSISGKELLTVGAADRDHPVVQSDLELSWSVDRVLLAGDFVLEVASGNSWYGWWSQSSATPPSVRVAKTSSPDQYLNRLVLSTNLPVLGATLRDGKLYVVQGQSSGGGPIIYDAAGSGQSTAPTNSPTLYLSVLDASQLPDIKLLGQTQALTDPLGWNANLNPTWPRPGLLVWSGAGGGLIPFGVGIGVGGAAGGGAGVGAASGVSSPIGIVSPWWGWNSGRLFAFDVSNAAAPNFVSEVNLTTNAWWSFSPAFTANGLVYISHQTSEFEPGVVLPDQPQPVPVITKDPSTGQPVTNTPPVGIWVERYYLDVVDYGDPHSPTLRTPVNIPGQLTGLDRNGALLYTLGEHWTNWVTDWSQWVDASAYDGVSAALVDSLPLPKDWPHPLLVSGSSLFLVRPNIASNTSQLETWVLADTGKFTQTGTLGLGATAYNLAAFGPLLAAQFNNSLVLLDATQPASLTTVGKGELGNCLGGNLTQADGSLTQGLWVPQGDYGLSQIPIAQ